VAPPHHRRSDPGLRRDLERLARFDAADGLRVRIERRGLAGVAEDDLRRQAGLAGKDLRAVLDELVADGSAMATPARSWVCAEAMAALETRLLEALAAYHLREPLRPGMPTSTLRGALPENVSRDVAQCAVDRLAAREAIVIEGDVARDASFATRLDQEDQRFVDRIVADARAAGLDSPSERDWAERLGTSVDHLKDLLAHLKRQGRLVRAPGNLWFDADAVAALRDRILLHFETQDRLETVDYKALIGATRRTAVPLMEYFDDERLTSRSGNARVLRGS
jgi:selenocysteine-specific elongation factor